MNGTKSALPDGLIRQAPFRHPMAVYANSLTAGDMVVLDPYYGLEEILHAQPLTLTNGVACLHLHVRRWRDTESEGRFVVRAAYEPITRWVDAPITRWVDE